MLIALIVPNSTAQHIQIGLQGSLTPEVTYFHNAQIVDRSPHSFAVGGVVAVEVVRSFVAGLQVQHSQGTLVDLRSTSASPAFWHTVSTLSLELPLLYQHELSQQFAFRAGALVGGWHLTRIMGFEGEVHTTEGSSTERWEKSKSRGGLSAGPQVGAVVTLRQAVQVELGVGYRFARVTVTEGSPGGVSADGSTVTSAVPAERYTWDGLRAMLGVYYRF